MDHADFFQETDCSTPQQNFFPEYHATQADVVQDATVNQLTEELHCFESLKTKVRKKIEIFQHQRSGTHGRCVACGFIQLSKVRKLKREFRLLMHESKIFCLKLECSEVQLDKNILQVAKCMKIQHIVEFLCIQFGCENLYLTFNNQPLASSCYLADYQICHGDMVSIHCGGLKGGAGKWNCRTCSLNFASETGLKQHNALIHPERVAFLETTLMGKYFSDQSKKDKVFKKETLSCHEENCDFIAKDQRALVCHKRSHTKDDNQCSICKKQFKTK